MTDPEPTPEPPLEMEPKPEPPPVLPRDYYEDLIPGTPYRRRSDGELMTLIRRFPITFRTSMGPWVTTYERFLDECEEVTDA